MPQGSTRVIPAEIHLLPRTCYLRLPEEKGKTRQRRTTVLKTFPTNLLQLSKSHQYSIDTLLIRTVVRSGTPWNLRKRRQSVHNNNLTKQNVFNGPQLFHQPPESHSMIGNSSTNPRLEQRQ